MPGRKNSDLIRTESKKHVSKTTTKLNPEQQLKSGTKQREKRDGISSTHRILFKDGAAEKKKEEWIISWRG